MLLSISAFLVLFTGANLASSNPCSPEKMTHGYTLESCCNGEVYVLGHDRVQFAEECLMEPREEGLPYKEDHWAFYECIVRKTLGEDVELTEENYVNMMMKNMSEGKREEIGKQLSEHLFAIEPNENATDRERLKFFWRRYMRAEFQVCGQTLRTTQCDRKFEDKDGQEKCHRQLRHVYEPPIFCTHSHYAKAANPYNGTMEDYNHCIKEQVQFIMPAFADPTKDHQKMKNRASVLCIAMNTFGFDPQELYRTDFNFTDFFENIIPRFLSASSKDLVYQAANKFLWDKGLRKVDMRNPDPLAELINYIQRPIPGKPKMEELTEHQRLWTNLEGVTLVYLLAQNSQNMACSSFWRSSY